MSRHDFTEIMRFIRFDDINERSQRLQTDEVRYKFIGNSRKSTNKRTLSIHAQQTGQIWYKISIFGKR